MIGYKKIKDSKLISGGYIIFLISLLIGTIFVLPHILIPIFQEGNIVYKPLVVNGVNTQTVDETFYASNIREVYDGHIIVRDSQLFEHKNDITITPIFPYIILGYMTYLTGSVENTYIISDFIFPLLTFLLVYFLMFRLTKDRYISALCGCAMLLRGFIFREIKAYIFNLPQLHIQKILGPLGYQSRLPFTQFTFIILISAIVLLYLFLKGRKTIYGVLCGLFMGLLFYTYLYHWTFFFIGIGILFLIFLIKRDYKNSKRVFIVLAIGMLISIPYWIDFAKFKSEPYSEEILGRMDMVSGRMPSISNTITYLLFLSLFVILVKKRDEIFYIFISLLLGGIVCINIQVFLGYSIQAYHWPLTSITPLIVIMIFYMTSEVLVREYNLGAVNWIITISRRYYKPLFVFLILIFLTYGTYHNYMFSRNTYRYYTLPNTIIEAYRWLDRNTQTDDVILSASVENINLIPVYTRDNNFIPNAVFTVASTQEILDRTYIAYKLLNVSPSYLENLMRQDNAVLDKYYRPFGRTGIPNTEIFEEVFWIPTLFHSKFFSQGGYEIPEEIMKGILSNYNNYTNNIDELLNRYRVDYIYYGQYERKISSVNLTEYKQFRELYKNEDVTIYKVLKY